MGGGANSQLKQIMLFMELMNKGPLYSESQF